jgi:hypothetical protein
VSDIVLFGSDGTREHRRRTAGFTGSRSSRQNSRSRSSDSHFEVYVAGDDGTESKLSVA